MVNDILLCLRYIVPPDIAEKEFPYVIEKIRKKEPFNAAIMPLYSLN